MHEDYYDNKMLMLAGHAECNSLISTSLRELCLRAVSLNTGAVHLKALELPTSILRDLLPYLNVTGLDRLQPGLNLKGISTHSAWVRILQDIRGPHNVGLLTTEEESKQEVMETLLQDIFYGTTDGSTVKYISNNNDSRDVNPFLLVLAKYTKHFSLRPSQFLQSLASEQRPLLGALERSVSRVDLKKPLVGAEPRYTLYALHRILDHGRARELIVDDPDSGLLPWLLHARGSGFARGGGQRPIKSARGGGKAACRRVSEEEEEAGGCSDRVAEAAGDEEEEDHAIPRKRAKFRFASEGPSPCGFQDPEDLCGAFAPAPGPSRGRCPRGRIESLRLSKCSGLSELIPFLPTWLCLRSLTLESHSLDLDPKEVMSLASALRQLCATPGSVLADLSVGVLPHAGFLALLLNACPNLRSLAVEIDPDGCVDPANVVQSVCSTELPLESLSVMVSVQLFSRSLEESCTVSQEVTNVDSITSTLQRSPQLTSLHLSGIKQHFSIRKLLYIVSESNQRLRKLCLEDLNLALCPSEILRLLTSCVLEELSLQNCRLFERCSESFPQQLVASLRNISSLRSLNLFRNRLAKNVPMLAELFAGTLASRVTKLDISFNDIQPEELLTFGRRLLELRPPQRLTLDLRGNPWKSDPPTWGAALATLRPTCHLVTDQLE